MTCSAWRCFGVGPRPGLQLLLAAQKSLVYSCLLPLPTVSRIQDRMLLGEVEGRERKELTKGAPKALLMFFLSFSLCKLNQ